MNRYFIFIIYCQIILSVQAGNKINYISPSPGSKMVNIENNIILAFEKPVALSADELKNCITVTGASGKRYPGTVKVTDENRILYIPDNYFKHGDNIMVIISGSLAELVNGQKNYGFSFETSRFKPNWNPENSIYREIEPAAKSYENPVFTSPPLLPVMTVTTNTNPEEGYLFLSNFGVVIQYTPYLIITNKDAVPYAYSQLTGNGMDFKKQPNGNLTYYSTGKGKFYELSPSFTVLDSFYCGNGYSTDEHELRVLSNRHALLMCYDVQIVNMTLIIQGGDTAAHVTGLVLQEIDENKNVVFQWRSWDHFSITDAWHENLTLHNIDYVHCNAIDPDNDGNLLISSRHMDEITKINRATGAIIWRLGGKNNQFTLINDTLTFNYQHAVRRISNGNITIFDNGVFRFPQFSRAVEYSLDEQNRTATRVWEYRNTPSEFRMAMGYVQRLPGGNTLISWGNTNPTVTEVNPAGTKVFEMTMVPYMYSYRVYKFPWNGPTVINNENNSNPSEFSLKQNYPNPFNPNTSIKYSLKQDSWVTLIIYNILGQEVKKLVDSYGFAGFNSVIWDGTNNYGSQVSSGIYFYKLTAGDFTDQKKMVIIR